MHIDTIKYIAGNFVLNLSATMRNLNITSIAIYGVYFYTALYNMKTKLVYCQYECL